MALINPVSSFYSRAVTVATNLFFDEVVSHPAIRKTERKISDAIRDSQQSVLDIPGVISTIGKVHGTYNQVSDELVAWSGALFGINSELDEVIKNLNEINNTVANAINVTTDVLDSLNTISFANLGLEFVRHHITQIDNLNPAVRAFVDKNLSSFPYFAPISESIGGILNITLDEAIAPLLSLDETGGVESQMTTSPVRKELWGKLYAPYTNMIDLAEAKLNNLIIRKTKDSAFGKFIDEIDQNLEQPLAHGYALANDVYNRTRYLQSRSRIAGKFLSKYNDQLRILDNFFPVQCSISFGRQLYDVPIGDFMAVTTLLGDKFATRYPQNFSTLGANDTRLSRIEQELLIVN